jgi:transcriptional regulator with XRE-family HTH domain
MADLQHTVGSVIRRERRERGLTLKALAERSALSVVYLGEIERGKKYPSAQVLEQLAKALELDLAELLELVADELRGVAGPSATSATSAMGFTLPRDGDSAPRATVRRLVQMLEPHEAATMAELGAFFLARRTGKPEAE